MSSSTSNLSYYAYSPSHALPAVFAALVGVSLLLHIWQNFRYRFWRVTFFLFWGGLVCTIGWILRCFASYNPTNKNLYIAQTVFILAGPPIYSAAEYNILGRLMHYIPMHAFLNPNRVVIFFIYVGAAVEGITGAGAALMASAGDDRAVQHQGATLVAIGAVLQAAVELVFVALVGVLHYRCAKSNMVTRNVRNTCIMLYGGSALVFVRCVYRAIEKFSIAGVLATETCDTLCGGILRNEWYLYVFDGVTMTLYTYWFNFLHPGSLLPPKSNYYLDFDKVLRIGPGWTDKRSQWVALLDPCNFQGKYDRFWLRPQEWPVVVEGNNNHGSKGNDLNETSPSRSLSNNV